MATIWDNIEIIGLDNNPTAKKAVEKKVEEVARLLPDPHGVNPVDEMCEAAEALQARDENRAARKARKIDDALDAVCGDGTAATLRSLDGVKKLISGE